MSRAYFDPYLAAVMDQLHCSIQSFVAEQAMGCRYTSTNIQAVIEAMRDGSCAARKPAVIDTGKQASQSSAIMTL